MSWSSSTLEINAAYLFSDLLDIRFRDSFYRLRVRALGKAKTLNALCSHLVKSLSSRFRWPTILSRLLASMVVSPLSNAYDCIDYQFIHCRWPKHCIQSPTKPKTSLARQPDEVGWLCCVRKKASFFASSTVNGTRSTLNWAIPIDTETENARHGVNGWGCYPRMPIYLSLS